MEFKIVGLLSNAEEFEELKTIALVSIASNRARVLGSQSIKTLEGGKEKALNSFLDKLLKH